MNARLSIIVTGIALVFVSLRSEAQVPTDLEDCVAIGASFCTDSTAVLVDDSCGETFNRYYGRLAWPPLRNVGPVTIAVETINAQGTTYPLYVEVRGRNDSTSTDCRTDMAGHLVLVAQGGTQCGGTWESVGPVDLTPYGVALGENYHVQCVFFESMPGPLGGVAHTIGFSCIKVTSQPDAVHTASWSLVKHLYRDPAR